MNALAATTSLALSFPLGRTLFQKEFETPSGTYMVTLNVLPEEVLRLARVPLKWVFHHGEGVLEITETPKAGSTDASLLAQVIVDASAHEVKTDWVPSDTNRAYFAGEIFRIPLLLRTHGFDPNHVRELLQALTQHTSARFSDKVSSTVEITTQRPVTNDEMPPRPYYPPTECLARLHP